MSTKAALCISPRLTMTDKQNVSGLRHFFIRCRSSRQGQFTCACMLLLSPTLGCHGFGLKFLCLVMCDERVDEWVEVAFHHEIQLVNR